MLADLRMWSVFLRELVTVTPRPDAVTQTVLITEERGQQQSVAHSNTDWQLSVKRLARKARVHLVEAGYQGSEQRPSPAVPRC